MLENKISQTYPEEIKNGMKNMLTFLSMFSSANTPELSFRVAQLMTKLGRDEEALARINAAIDSWPEEAQLHHLKAGILLKMGRLSEARISYDDCINKSSARAEAYYGRGLLLKRMGLLKESLEEFSRVIEMNPDLIAAFEEKSLLETMLGMTEQSTKDKKAAKEGHRKRAKELAEAGDISFIVELNRAVELDPDDVQILLERGAVFAQLQQFELAETDIRRVLKLEPKNSKTWMLMFAIAQQSGKLEQTMVEAVKINPDSAEILIEYAKFLLSNGKFDEGLKLIDEFSQKHPKDISLLNVKAGICFNKEGMIEEAVKLAKELKEVKQEDDSAFLLYGEIFEKVGDISTALECFDIGLKINPNNPRIMFKRAIAFIANPTSAGQDKMSAEEAATFTQVQLSAIDRAIEIDPTEITFYLGKTSILANIGSKLKEAIECADKGMAIDPKNSQLLTLKAQFLLKADQNDEALKAITQSLEIDPTSLEALAVRGHILVAKNQYAEAAEQLKAIPENTFEGDQLIMFKMGMGMALVGISREEEALEIFEELHKVKPEMIEILNMKGACKMGLGEYKEALEIVENILRIKPGDFNSRLYKAFCEQALQMSEKALETIDDCIKQNPNDANSKRVKAEILEGRGQFQEAIKEISLSLKIDPKEENAYFVRGVSFYFLKHYDEALKNADHAMGIVPERTDFQMLRCAVFLMKGAVESFLKEIDEAKKLIAKGMPRMMGTSYRKQFKDCFERFYELVEVLKDKLYGPQLEILQHMITKFLQTVECGPLTTEKTNLYLNTVKEQIDRLKPAVVNPQSSHTEPSTK